MNLETVPAYEIERRITALQKRLGEDGIDLAIIRQAADLYYFTGTVQEGHLVIPAQGEPLFLVWRSLERALQESPLASIEPLDSMGRLPEVLGARGLLPAGRCGMELDCLPANLFLRYQELLAPARIVDCSHLVRSVRALKSEWEVGCIRRACQKAWGAMETAQGLLAPGVTDLEVAVAVEGYLRRMGHPGVLRMRLWNHEIGMDQVLTGPAGALPAWTSTPAGGRGMSTAYGMGASGARYEPGSPFTVDVAAYHRGYLCDQTRTFSPLPLEPTLERALELAIAIESRVESMLRPGVQCGAIYDQALSMVESTGLEEAFMGYGRDRVRFIGHGVGVELDEYPFISSGNTMALEPGMVVAVEPKFCLPGKGMVGVEDTYLITAEGCQRLTLGPLRL